MATSGAGEGDGTNIVGVAVLSSTSSPSTVGNPRPRELLLLSLLSAFDVSGLLLDSVVDNPMTGDDGDVSVSSVIPPPPPMMSSCKEALLEVGEIEASLAATADDATSVLVF